MKNLVSVIITTYQSEDTITDCINSVLDQTYNNIEIIIIDDGSKDNTRSVINKFIKNKKNIKYIYQENKGISSARNKGIKLAKGEFILFLDSDDTLPKKSIEYRLKYLIKNKNIDSVFGNTNYCNKNKSYSIRKINKKNLYKLKKSKLKESFLTADSAPFCPMSLFFRTKTIKQLGFWDINIRRSVDSDYIYRLLDGFKVGYLNKIVYNYNVSVHKPIERIKYLILQYAGKIKVICKYKKGIYKFWLICSNTINLPLKVLHQLIFYNLLKK